MQITIFEGFHFKLLKKKCFLWLLNNFALIMMQQNSAEDFKDSTCSEESTYLTMKI